MFDPYHKWLGIPKDEQPPTHYRLLGVNKQEKDREVIEEAAIKQQAHIRTYQLGPHAAECTRLLNKIAEARATLLDASKRKTYDDKLAQAEKQRKGGEPYEGITEKPAPAISAFAGLNGNDAGGGAVRRPSDRPAPNLKKRPRWVVPVSVFGGASVLFLIAVAIYWFSREASPSVAARTPRPTAKSVVREATSQSKKQAATTPPGPPIAKEGNDATELNGSDPTPINAAKVQSPPPKLPTAVDPNGTAKLVFDDEFRKMPSLWPQGNGENIEHGQRDGLYRIRLVRGGIYGWSSPARVDGDWALRITGRILGQREGAWGVFFDNGSEEALRQGMILVFGNGMYSWSPGLWDKVLKESLKPVGPAIHAAIKPGEETNELLVVARGGQVTTFINNQRIGEPITVGYDMARSRFGVMASGPAPREGESPAEAEFSRFSLWRLDEPRRFRSQMGNAVARQTVANAISAMGGESKAAALKDGSCKAETIFQEGANQVRAGLQARWTDYDQYRLSAWKIFKYENGRNEIVNSWIDIDGGQGSVREILPDRTRKWSSQEAAWNIGLLDAVRSAQSLPRLLRDDVDLSSLGESKVGGRTALGVAVSRQNRQGFTIYFDRATNLPIRSEIRLLDPQGRQQTFAFEFDDYQDCNGLKQPMRISVSLQGKNLTIAISELQASVRNVSNGTTAPSAPTPSKQPKATPENNLPDQPKQAGPKLAAELVKTLKAHKKDVWRVSFSRDSSIVASAGDDSEVIEWLVKTGTATKRYPQGDFIHGLAHDSKGQWFCSASMTPYGPAFCGAGKLFYLPTRQLLEVESRGAWCFSAAAIHPEGKFWALGGRDRALRIWDLETYLKVAGRYKPAAVPLKQYVTELTPIATPGEIWSLSFHPKDRQLAVGLNNGSVVLYDLVSTRDPKTKAPKVGPLYTIEPAKAKLAGHNNGAPCVAFSPDGKVLASVGHDGTMALWDPTDGRRIKEIKVSDARLEWAAWHPSGEFIATAGANRSVIVWSGAKGERLLELKSHTASVLCAAFSPDGRWLATASSDFTVGLWSIQVFGELTGKKQGQKK